MAAAYAHAHAAVGGAEGVDQSFAGLVLQILEGGSGDAQGQGVGLGLQVARPFSHHVEHNFAHGGYHFLPHPSLAVCSGSGRAVGYGEPSCSPVCEPAPSDAWRSPECRALFLPVMTPTREQILAASAGWVAVVLNVLPGLGAGYLYQRRWRAYWITSALATAWFVAGAALAQNAPAEAEAQNQLVGLIGLLILAGVTATEAGLAVKRVRQPG